MRIFIPFLVVLIGCSRAGDKVERGGSAEVVAALQTAGLVPRDMKDTVVATLGDARCRAGHIDDIEITLCELATEEAAKEAIEPAHKVVGETTGAVLASGRVVLIVADRRNADPSGKRINQIARTFHGI